MVRALTVAFQGEPGAFSEEAVHAFFGDQPETRAVPSWRSVFEAVRDGEATAGVVAIESSLAGSIRETYDLLSEFYDDGIRIVGETSVPVRLALVALPGQSIDEIERVYSHAQALAQADEFLRARDWQVMTTYNTAGAARMIAENGERGAAAIASPRVAELYGLEILADNIQTGDENRTRFAILAREGDIARRALGHGGGRSAPDDPGLRGPKRARVAPPLSRGRSLRAGSISRASSPARRGARDGSTCSGWTSTRMRPILIARRPSRPSAVRRRWSGFSARIRGRKNPEVRRLPRFAGCAVRYPRLGRGG